MAHPSGRYGWTFVDEQPQKTPAKSTPPAARKARRPRVQPRTSSSPPEIACTNCQSSKVKCCSSSAFQRDCDRCLRKNLTCVRKQSTRFTPELSTQLALVDSGQIIKPEVKPEFIPEEPQPGVVRKALNSVQQVTTYVASGLYSMLENRLNGILAMGGTLNAILAVGGARHLTWCLTYCLLRREVVRNQLQTTAPLEPTVLVNVEGHWLFDWPIAWKKVMAIGPDALCARARRSLCRDPAIMQRNCLWIPAHLPQIHGPDAVFITTGVLGKVSKYTNHAWNRHFRNVDEMHDFMQTLTTPQPLAEVGLFPLIGVIPAASQREVTNKYFWNTLLRTNMTTICGTSTAADYTSCTEFTTHCDDKFGNRLEFNITIYTCFQHEGAVFIRVIRCIPMCKRLKPQVRSRVLAVDTTGIPKLKTEPDIEVTSKPKRQKFNNHPSLEVPNTNGTSSDLWDEFADIDDDLTR